MGVLSTVIALRLHNGLCYVAELLTTFICFFFLITSMRTMQNFLWHLYLSVDHCNSGTSAGWDT